MDEKIKTEDKQDNNNKKTAIKAKQRTNNSNWSNQIASFQFEFLLFFVRTCFVLILQKKGGKKLACFNNEKVMTVSESMKQVWENDR